MFFKKKLPTIDVELNEISQLLFVDDSIPFPNQKLLKSINHNYTLDSLADIENYLNTIRDFEELEQNYNLIVLRVGAYLGEVIKKNSRKDYHWYDFETAIKLEPSIKDYEDPIRTVAVLHSSNTKNTTFPINKVCKYLENGSEDSLFFYAQVMIE